MGTDTFARQVQGIRDEEILKAALKMFGERGQLMRIEDVTVAVGIGKGTLYRHYDSRVNLLRAALAYGVRELQARALAARNAARHEDTPDEAELRAVIGELAAMNARRDAVAPAVLCRLRVCEQWPSPLEAGAEPTEALIPVVAQWQSEGLLDASEAPAWVSTMILGVINSPLFASATNGEMSSLTARVSTLVRRAFPPR
jgi:AcrR family transcriptional regulator